MDSVWQEYHAVEADALVFRFNSAEEVVHVLRCLDDSSVSEELARRIAAEIREQHPDKIID
jgi:hypothetical protein